MKTSSEEKVKACDELIDIILDFFVKKLHEFNIKTAGDAFSLALGFMNNAYPNVLGKIFVRHDPENAQELMKFALVDLMERASGVVEHHVEHRKYHNCPHCEEEPKHNPKELH